MPFPMYSQGINPLALMAMMGQQGQQGAAPMMPAPLQRMANSFPMANLTPPMPPQIPGQQGAQGGQGQNPMMGNALGLLGMMRNNPMQSGNPFAQLLQGIGGSGLLGQMYGGMPE